MRLAVVQHGDYREALEIVSRGAPEPYFGMKHSVELIERFLEGSQYRLISVDAENYHQPRANGEIIGFRRPAWKKLSKFPWSYTVYRSVVDFRPTHLLMRTGGLIAYPTLRWACRHNVNSLVVMAGYMKQATGFEGLLSKKLVQVLNHPSVYLACNHRRPAAISTIDAGVHPSKVKAWDFAGIPNPADFPVKSLREGSVRSIVFAGEIKEGKGIGDLVESMFHMARHRSDFRLIVCGDGDMREELEKRSRQLPTSIIHFLGRVGNDEVQRQMLAADLVCVPSRKDRSEGLPFTFTEALATRTPVIATDHPAVTRLLADGEGIRVVPSSSPVELAKVISNVLSDPKQYTRLSIATSDAFARIGSDITFDELLSRWRTTW